MVKKLISIGLILLGQQLFIYPVHAGGLEVTAPSRSESSSNTSVGLDANQKNDNQTLQQNSGSVSNVAVQNVNLGTYSFGPGISCSTPGIAVNGFSNNGDYRSADTYGATVSFLMPLGGATGRACRKLAREIAKQKVLDTNISLIRLCADLKKAGIEVDPQQYPDIFEACQGVKLTIRK